VYSIDVILLTKKREDHKEWMEASGDLSEKQASGLSNHGYSLFIWVSLL